MDVPYTIFDAATGVIDKWGDATNPANMVRDGQDIIIGEKWNDALYRIDVATRQAVEATAHETQEYLRICINRERERRIVVGKDFGGVWVTGSDKDQLNLLALKDTARDLLAADVTAPVIPFRDGNNVEHLLTPQQIIDLANAGKMYVSAIYQASWALKDGPPDATDYRIPQDVTNDQYWPQ